MRCPREVEVPVSAETRWLIWRTVDSNRTTRHGGREEGPTRRLIESCLFLESAVTGWNSVLAVHHDDSGFGCMILELIKDIRSVGLGRKNLKRCFCCQSGSSVGCFGWSKCIIRCSCIFIILFFTACLINMNRTNG